MAWDDSWTGQGSGAWGAQSNWDGGGWQSGVKRKKPEPPKRENKNQPQVLSSKRQVSRFRLAPGLKGETGASSASNSRDPRFDPMSAGSKINEAGWRKSYDFLFQAQEARVKELQEQLSTSAKQAQSKSAKSGGGEKKRQRRLKILSPEAEAEARAELQKLKSRLKADQQKQREQEVLSAVRKEEVAAVKEGKGIYFQKKSVVREKLLKAKYEDLEKTGQLNKFMAKRRQKMANKQHKRLPGRRDDGWEGDGGEEWS